MSSALRPRLDLIVVTTCALLLVLLAYERKAIVQHPPSVYSTYDVGPNGYHALYAVLRAAGLPVRRFEREVGELDPAIGTLIVTGYEHDPSKKPLDEHDARLLRRFVENGGRFVAIDAEFAGRNDVTPDVGTSLRANGNEAIALARNRYTAGVRRVGGSIGSIFAFKEPRAVPLLADRQGMVAVWYRVGRGEVIAVTAPALFGNAQLRNADNLRFAYNIIAGHGAAAFDEYVHGYDERLTAWAVMPGAVRAAVWIVVAIAMIGLIGANLPFAPPYLPVAADERDSSHYITAMAQLMRRSHLRPPDDEVTRKAAADFRRRKEHA